MQYAVYREPKYRTTKPQTKHQKSIIQQVYPYIIQKNTFLNVYFATFCNIYYGKYFQILLKRLYTEWIFCGYMFVEPFIKR